MKLKITVEGMSGGPIEAETEKGLILLVRHPNGVQRAILGTMNILDLALMMKTLTCGEDAETKTLRAAQQLVPFLRDYQPEAITDMHPDAGSGAGSWIDELLSTIGGKGGEADEADG